MSETDSFIDEVTEEVRRDRLFALFRKYGWIGILLVALIVGGAAWNEWQKARQEASAQAFGDAVSAALSNNDTKARLTALSAISAPDQSGQALILGLLTATEAEAAGDKDKAVAALKAIAGNQDVSDVYRQLAELKEVTIAGAAMDATERDQILAKLAAPGAPFRPLAMEQQALALIDAGKIDEAAAILSAIRDDAEATPALQSRADQILTVIGKETPKA